MYCGDGINDLAALAAADVGMAIGASDASAAASVSDKHTSVSGTGCIVLTEGLHTYCCVEWLVIPPVLLRLCDICPCTQAPLAFVLDPLPTHVCLHLLACSFTQSIAPSLTSSLLPSVFVRLCPRTRLISTSLFTTKSAAYLHRCADSDKGG